MNWLELVAVIAGLLCVYLIIIRSIWCWPVGLIQVSVYVWIFYHAKLYSDVGLHIIYIGLQLYGWWHWLYGGPGKSQLPVKKLSTRGVIAWVAISLVGSTSLGIIMTRYTDASLPFADAFTTVASLTAQWLLTRKYLQNWYFWIAVDVVAIFVYASKALYMTSALYALFLCMAIAGLVAWRNERAATRVMQVA